MIVNIPGAKKEEITLRFGLGDKVSFRTRPEVHAIVVAISIRQTGAIYECCWITEQGQLSTGYFLDFEIDDA